MNDIIDNNIDDNHDHMSIYVYVYIRRGVLAY